MRWDKNQLSLAEKYHKNLGKIPKAERRYKCAPCAIAFPDVPENKISECPKCHTTGIQIMCPLDHTNCFHEIFPFSEICPLCDQPICPDCGSHDVAVISRITGYLQDLSGWNNAKQQEFRDRHRYDIT